MSTQVTNYAFGYTQLRFSHLIGNFYRYRCDKKIKTWKKKNF